MDQILKEEKFIEGGYPTYNLRDLKSRIYKNYIFLAIDGRAWQYINIKFN